MTAIPLLNGITATVNADLAQSYPLNYEPVVLDSGIAKGYLRAVPGIDHFGTGPGRDRGGIVWNGVCFRVMGTKLVSVGPNGEVVQRGDVGDDGKPVSFDYSFDRLAVASAGGLYYWTGSAFSQVTDGDLGAVRDMLWVDGYFLTTDGTSLVVTELTDPLAVDPLKYGSSEADPDPVMGLTKIRGEVYALNRHTVEVFQDQGGTGFPFTRYSGGMIPKGCVGRWAKAHFLDTFAFVGSGRNEALSVYLAGPGRAISISTSDIDKEINALSDAEQARIEVESRTSDDEQRLLIHLPTKTLVYLASASSQAEEPVWYTMGSGAVGDAGYVLRHLVRAYGRWLGGAADGRIGALDETSQSQFGAIAGARFDTVLIYNKAKGGIIRSLELVGLPGRTPFGTDPKCWFSYTLDGVTYSEERSISMGQFGQRGKRVQWRPKVRFRNYVGFRFRTANTAIASWATLEADIEGLAG